MKKEKIVVIMGGYSTEREIPLKSGEAVGKALRRAGYEVEESVFAFGDRILVETFIAGKELTVPILGNETVRTLPIIEITFENEFYNFDSKYTPGKSQHIIPARIDKKQVRM